jgi:hypothetical protein
MVGRHGDGNGVRFFHGLADGKSWRLPSIARESTGWLP